VNCKNKRERIVFDDDWVAGMVFVLFVALLLGALFILYVS
jgi:hypothetical protein